MPLFGIVQPLCVTLSTVTIMLFLLLTYRTHISLLNVRENDAWLNSEMVLEKRNYFLILIGLLLFLLLVIVEMIVVTLGLHESLPKFDIFFCKFGFDVRSLQTFAAAMHE